MDCRRDVDSTLGQVCRIRPTSTTKYALIVELDGRAGHEGIGQFRDMDRDNRHMLVNARTLRFGSYDLVARPCGVAFQVYSALVRQGYLEAFVRCRHCLAATEADLLFA